MTPSLFLSASGMIRVSTDLRLPMGQVSAYLIRRPQHLGREGLTRQPISRVGEGGTETQRGDSIDPQSQG